MLHDRVMIKRVEGSGERRSSAGIVIPATAQVAKRLVWGEVVGVGQHVRTVKAGDRVHVRTPGGGGYGPATQRDPALVAEDVRLGRYTADEAKKLFG